MDRTKYPRRVQTSVIRKAKRHGLRRDGFNYRVLSGQALHVYLTAKQGV